MVPVLPPFPESWRRVLGAERDKPYFRQLEQFVDAERSAGPVYPAATEIDWRIDED